MARKYSLQALTSFAGGLNYRTDQFNLAQNESPDLLNVDVDPRGGIRLRKGIEVIDGAGNALGAVKGLGSYFTDGGLSEIICNHGVVVAFSTGSSAWTPIGGQTARTSGSRMYGVTMNNVFYAVSGDVTSFKVSSGNSGTDLGTNLNGTAGNFPISQYVAFWNNHMWTGKTRESSVYYNSRIRWSHLNDAETWTQQSYADIDVGERGDEITGLVPMADRLLIFKSNSVHAMFGHDTESFQMVPLTRDVGSVSLSSPVSTPMGVFFWHDQAGVYLYDGTNFNYLFDKLKPAIDDGRIRFNTPPQLAWFRNRLYVSVDWTEDGLTTRRTLVYDPSLGAWTLTDIDAEPLLAHVPPGGEPFLIGACKDNSGRVIKLEQNRYTDLYATTPAQIVSHFTTPWVSGKNPIVQKRWGKPRFIMDTSATGTVNYEVYNDYDKATSVTKTFQVTGRGSTSVFGTATWRSDSGDTGDGTWSASAGQSITDVIKLTTMGSAKSVAIKINGPNHTSAYEVNAMMFTYVPRRLR